MSWKIQIIDRPRAVCGSATGLMGLAAVKQFVAELRMEAARAGLNRILIDDRNMTPQLSTLEIHNLPDILGRLGFVKNDPVAIVYSETSPKAADFRFFENTALNRGFRLRLFTRIDDALEWLARIGCEAPQLA